MEEVELICDYIVIMDKGIVVAHGTKETLKNSITLGETIEIQVLIHKNNILTISRRFLMFIKHTLKIIS